MDEEVERWLEKAESDYEAAEFIFKSKYLYVAAFLAQQAAEKALKALYISKKGKLRKTHELVELARDVDAPKELIAACASITPAYTATRYPDIADIYDKEEVRALIKSSLEVIEWVKKNLR
jgi:HEPN domain-containing protein